MLQVDESNKKMRTMQEEMIKLQEKLGSVQTEFNVALSEKRIDYEKSLMIEVKVKLALKDILDLKQ